MKKFCRFALPVIVGVLYACSALAEDAVINPFFGTAWSLVPPLVAIALALLTKEVYSSLFCGIVVGALLNCRFNVVSAVDVIINNGLIEAITGTAGIFVFLAALGALTMLINQSGGSAAFGRWAQTHVKSKVDAQLFTFVLGILIFIDDYFNCLTVGSVMQPVADNHKVSRAKLAYLIDATAAPICMIAPISSWAAAVSDYTSGMTNAAGESISSFALFCRAIPYNFYSLLTLVFIVAITLMRFDYGSMKKHELNAAHGDLFTSASASAVEETEIEGSDKGTVLDLVLPIGVLILTSVLTLLYVGGFFSGEFKGDFVGAFGNTDATVGLPMSGLIALTVTIIYMVARRLISFTDAMSCIPKGMSAMVPSILILTMATALKNMTGMLGSFVFVETALADAGALYNFLPAIIFVVACAISFSTGTSWGTFGILIPIVLGVFPAGSELAVIGMSACLAGSVCGDHCSPISDTTIMSSAGAQCDHMNHVSTQLPYAMTVAVVSFASYLLTGFVQNWMIVLPVAIALTLGTLVIFEHAVAKRQA